MSIDLGPITFIEDSSGASSNTSTFTHQPGWSILVIVHTRALAANAVSSVTFAGTVATQLVSTVVNDQTDPICRTQMFMVDAHTASTGSLVITWAGVTTWVHAYVFDLRGHGPGGYDAGTESSIGSVGSNYTFNRSSMGSLTVLSACRSRAAAAITWSPNQADSVEQQERDGGANPSLSSTLETAIEQAVGNVTRGATASTNGKLSGVCLAIYPAESIFVEGFGGRGGAEKKRRRRGRPLWARGIGEW